MPTERAGDVGRAGVVKVMRTQKLKPRPAYIRQGAGQAVVCRPGTNDDDSVIVPRRRGSITKRLFSCEPIMALLTLYTAAPPAITNSTLPNAPEGVND